MIFSNLNHSILVYKRSSEYQSNLRSIDHLYIVILRYANKTHLSKVYPSPVTTNPNEGAISELMNHLIVVTSTHNER